MISCCSVGLLLGGPTLFSVETSKINNTVSRQKFESLEFLIPVFYNPNNQNYLRVPDNEPPPLTGNISGVRFNNSGTQPSRRYYSVSNVDFRRLKKTLVLPCDVPSAQAYFMLAAFTTSHDLYVYTKPLVNTPEYRSAHATLTTANPGGISCRNWDKWCEITIGEIIEKLSYTDVVSNMIPFKDFLPTVLRLYS